MARHRADPEEHDVARLWVIDLDPISAFPFEDFDDRLRVADRVLVVVVIPREIETEEIPLHEAHETPAIETPEIPTAIDEGDPDVRIRPPRAHVRTDPGICRA